VSIKEKYSKERNYIVT